MLLNMLYKYIANLQPKFQNMSWLFTFLNHQLGHVTQHDNFPPKSYRKEKIVQQALKALGVLMSGGKKRLLQSAESNSSISSLTEDNRLVCSKVLSTAGQHRDCGTPTLDISAKPNSDWEQLLA